jgi:hypothetical protein
MPVGHGPAGAGHTLKPRRMTMQPVIEKVSTGHRDEAPPRCGVTLGGVRRRVEGHASLERGRHPTEARQVVTNPRSAAGSPVGSDWLRPCRCPADQHIMTP